jgi:hypothetical protein
VAEEELVQLEAVAEDHWADKKVKGALAIALAVDPVLAAAGGGRKRNRGTGTI